MATTDDKSQDQNQVRNRASLWDVKASEEVMRAEREADEQMGYDSSDKCAAHERIWRRQLMAQGFSRQEAIDFANLRLRIRTGELTI